MAQCACYSGEYIVSRLALLNSGKQTVRTKDRVRQRGICKLFPSSAHISGTSAQRLLMCCSIVIVSKPVWPKPLFFLHYYPYLLHCYWAEPEQPPPCITPRNALSSSLVMQCSCCHDCSMSCSMTVSLHPHLLVCFLCFIYNDLHDLTLNVFRDLLLWIAPTQHSHRCRQGASCRHYPCLTRSLPLF